MTSIRLLPIIECCKRTFSTQTCLVGPALLCDLPQRFSNGRVLQAGRFAWWEHHELSDGFGIVALHVGRSGLKVWLVPSRVRRVEQQRVHQERDETVSLQQQLLVDVSAPSNLSEKICQTQATGGLFVYLRDAELANRLPGAFR